MKALFIVVILLVVIGLAGYLIGSEMAAILLLGGGTLAFYASKN